MKNNKFKILFLTIFLFLSSCEKESFLDKNNNTAQELKIYIDTNGKSNFSKNIQWENAILYNRKNESTIYVPIYVGKNISKITLKATRKNGEFYAFYSFYNQKENYNNEYSQINTTANYDLKGNFISSFTSKKNEKYIYTKVFRNRKNKETTKFALLNMTNGSIQKKSSIKNIYLVKKIPIVYFEELDDNQDGFISMEESSVYPGLKCHFSEYDMNEDGMLDKTEYLVYSTDPQGCDELIKEVTISASSDNSWDDIDTIFDDILANGGIGIYSFDDYIGTEYLMKMDL